MSSPPSPARPSRLWLLQGAHLASALGLIAVWVFVVPGLLRLPDEVAFRIRFYPLFLVPVILILLAANHFWLAPLLRIKRSAPAGGLSAADLDLLVTRAVRYPYHAFTVAGAGALVTVAAIAVVQSATHPTEPRLVVELVILAFSLGIIFALASFFIGRLALAPLLWTPGVTLSVPRGVPDLRKRVVLGLVCVLLVVWSVLGVLVIDHQTALAAAGSADPVLHPQVVHTAVFLVVAGSLFVLLAGVASSFMARDVISDIESVAGGLEDLAAAGVDAPAVAAPVLSPDEMGELTTAFNRVVARISEHDQVLRDSARRATEADQRQMEFFSVVSHDLRTPLHTITGFSQLLLDGVEGELEHEQQLDIRNILNAGHHLLSLLDDVVDLSKMESGMMALSRGRVALEEVVQQALDAADGLREGKPVELTSELPPGLPPVDADETRLRQILFNLVGNALKFTEKGAVRVRAEQQEEGMLTVRVEDSGPGIPAGSLERVFDEFEQVHAGSRTAARGTGLGLAITRRLVEMHGGTIQAANRPEGGAVFCFSLPLAADDPQPGATA